MNFELSEEQALLKAAIERFVADAYGGDMARRRGYRLEKAGFSAANWARLADSGVLALPFPVEAGGLGGGRVELIVAMEALGRGLVVEPVLDAIVIAGGLLHAAGDSDQKSEWLPKLMGGTARLALAHVEAAARFNLAHVGTTARRSGDMVVLNGVKTCVIGGAEADALLVSARDDEGAGFYIVPADARGVHSRHYRLADGAIACESALRDAAIPPKARLARGLDALMEIVATARLSAAAEMLGLAGLLLDTTLDHVRTREQFGQPLGKFQVIQHRLTDAYVAVEQARSQVLRAALADDRDFARAAAGCKAFVTEAALAVAHEAVQCHGGMGVTDELNVGHALKRLRVLALTFGDGASALADYARAA